MNIKRHCDKPCSDIIIAGAILESTKIVFFAHPLATELGLAGNRRRENKDVESRFSGGSEIMNPQNLLETPLKHLETLRPYLNRL